ncbi:MAG: biopolymer transporter ExbD [Deltaproteobacteria bacterium]|nr:biopolymer transporter ExbD [Deltaproteobacteria bacterium]
MSIIQVSKQRRQQSEIDIAPLIDIVFILLIFFMVTTTFIRDAKLEIERPGAKTAQQADNRSVRVSVGRRGEIFVDARPIKPWMLQAKMREIISRQRIKTVLVIADRRVETGLLVDVVDQCRLAGAQDVGVAVEQEI